MTFIDCDIVRWVSDEPQPGLVEARLVDAAGRAWTFIDKAPIFSVDILASSTSYPVHGVIRCTVVGEQVTTDETMQVVVDTSTPDGVEATDGTYRFSLRADQIRQ